MTNLFYIEKGETINASNVGLIGLSSNGSDWSFIPKEGLQISRSAINKNNNLPNALDKFEGSVEFVILRNALGEIEAKFRPSEIKGKAWSTATAAINEIAGWFD